MSLPLSISSPFFSLFQEGFEMTCPKCGHEQPDVFSQCQQCRYIFPRPSANVRKHFFGSVSATAGSSNGPSLLALIGALVTVLVLGAALWWLNSPDGLPLPDGAYINEKQGFALSVPAEWIMLTAENYEEVFRKLGSRFPKPLQEGLSQRKIEVGFLKLLENADFSPSVNIVVVQSAMPELDEEQKEEAATALTAEYKRLMEKFQMEESELITVDELTSLRFISRASMKFKVTESEAIYKETVPGWQTAIGHTPEEWKSYDLKFIQILVPGKRSSYIITCTAEASQYPQYRRVFENIIESFRVMEHPSRFGAILNGAIQGGLIGALGYLLYYIFMSLVALFKR